jgi:hypothetical protein
LAKDDTYDGAESIDTGRKVRQKAYILSMINEYASIINIYFYEFFLPFKPRALALQNIWDTLSDILDKCLHFSLIKVELVSINPSQAKSRNSFYYMSRINVGATKKIIKLYNAT